MKLTGTLQSIYVEGPYGDIYRVESMQGPKGFGMVRVANIDHPSPVEYTAWEALEHLARGLWRVCDSQSRAKNADIRSQLERGNAA